jgi:hypothetical protein
LSVFAGAAWAAAADTFCNPRSLRTHVLANTDQLRCLHTCHLCLFGDEKVACID